MNHSAKIGKILLIDDSSTNNLLLSSIFEETGFEVMVNEDATDIVSCTLQEMPLIILLDLMLPGTDGIQVLLQIKSDERLRHIPVIIYTAYESSQLKNQAYLLGASDYILKPVGAEEILYRISRLLPDSARNHLSIPEPGYQTE